MTQVSRQLFIFLQGISLAVPSYNPSSHCRLGLRSWCSLIRQRLTVSRPQSSPVGLALHYTSVSTSRDANPCHSVHGPCGRAGPARKKEIKGQLQLSKRHRRGRPQHNKQYPPRLGRFKESSMGLKRPKGLPSVGSKLVVPPAAKAPAFLASVSALLPDPWESDEVC